MNFFVQQITKSFVILNINIKLSDTEKELSNDRIETNLLFVYLARSRGC